MNKGIVCMFIMMLLFTASACTANEKDLTSELVEVDILIPDTLSVNEQHPLNVQLTQGNETVEDANDVQFEIWKANRREQSEMIEAKHTGNGIYQVEKTFSEDGIYFVKTHVTARDLHVMPTRQFIVGEVSQEELELLEHEGATQGAEHGHSHNH